MPVMTQGNRSHIGHKSIPATVAESMAAFDRLPHGARALIAACKFCPSPISIEAFLLSHGEEELAGAIARFEREAMLDYKMLRVWGDHHPEEVPTARAPKTEKDLGL